MSYLKQINWLDILALILLTRITYIAIKSGFPIEIFKLLGTVLAIFLSCHYYIKLSISLTNLLPFKSEVAIDFLNLFAFTVLASLGYFIFVIIRIVFTLLIRMEAKSLFNHWIALIFGIARFSLFISLLFFTFTVTNISYLENSLADSFFGPRLLRLTPKVYASLWDNLISRFMGEAGFNQEAL